MNAIGNDNYRPGLKPPEPMKQGKSWLSGNMAQLMVFLNGLILTITAFATLSVFIDEIVREGLVRTTDDVQKYVFSEYEAVERSLHALSAVITMPENVSTNQVREYMSHKTSGGEYFEQLYRIEKDPSDNWTVETLLAGKTYKQGFGSNLEFVRFFQNKSSERRVETFLVTSLPYEKLSNEEQENYVYDRPVGLVRVLGDVSSPQGYLVGVVRLKRIVQGEWLQNRNTVHDLQIVDASADLPIYSYQKNLVGKKKKNVGASRYVNIFSGNFADKSMDVKVELMINPRESFLQKIPLLMLLFGITLTLIGTLYVRNNQSQSQKLAGMNKELAHKNFELSQEMTERERLNHVIQKSARENRAVINAVSDIIFEVSVDGSILFLNDSWKKVTGFQLEQSIGRNLFDLLYVQDQEEQRQNFDLLVHGKKTAYRVFTRLRSADGTFRAVEMSISMLRQDENKDLRVVGTITDVEERRRAEQALSEAEKKYRTIVENAASGIYQVTPEGQFLSANPAFARILGYSSPEEVLRDVSKANEQIYVDANDRQRFLKSISTLDASKNFEAQIIRKDDKVIWVSENVRPVKDDEGTLLFYEGSIEDVDQRKKAELALKEAKTESDLANRAKSEFLANMSHELRTPLNSVIGFSEIIKNETFGKLPNGEYKEYADNIYESGNRLLRVINEILDVSRIEAGDRTLNESVVKISDTVESCLSLMDGKLKSNQMRVENKIKNSDLSFVGEVQAVKQMIMNLMSNAIKFSAPNSFMMIDAETDSKGRLRLSITDTGIGLTEGELEKAVSPFGQVDTDLNRSKSGTGLGLTLVKSLIELHGGELELVSQKGIGTTATLIFPAKRVASSAEIKEAEDEKHSHADDYAGADVFEDPTKS